MSTREEFTKRFPRYAECIENPQGHRRGKDLADAALAGFEAGYQAATSRQEANVKQMLEALEAISAYMPTTSALEGGASKFSGNVHAADKVRAAIAAAKEPDLSCTPRGITE